MLTTWPTVSLGWLAPGMAVAGLGQGLVMSPLFGLVLSDVPPASAGAVLVPLSSFDPARIPDPQGREVVFACRSGKRSVTASQRAQAAGLPYDAHLAGGNLAWKAAGHPTES